MRYKREVFLTIILFLSWNLFYMAKFIPIFSFKMELSIFSLILLFSWLYILQKDYLQTVTNMQITTTQIFRRIGNKLLSFAIYPMTIYVLVLWFAGLLYSAYIWGALSVFGIVIIFFDLIALRDIKKSVFIITDELRISLEISSVFLFFLSSLATAYIFQGDMIAFLVISILIGIILFIGEFYHFQSYKINIKTALLLLAFTLILIFITIFSGYQG